MFNCPICLSENDDNNVQCDNCCFPNFMSIYEQGFYSLFPQFNFARGGDGDGDGDEESDSHTTGTDVLSRCPVIVADPPRTCPICLSDDMYIGIRLEGCRHMFHEKCIETWLEKEVTCPVCRAQVSESSEKIK